MKKTTRVTSATCCVSALSRSRWAERKPARRLALLAIALAATVSAVGQIPRFITLTRFRTYKQVSATDVPTTGESVAATVSFPGAVPAGVAITVKSPAGAALTLGRGLSGADYSGETQIADESEFSRSYPDGTYTVTVSGGSFLSTTSIALSGTAPFGPILVKNYDAL